MTAPDFTDAERRALLTAIALRDCALVDRYQERLASGAWYWREAAAESAQERADLLNAARKVGYFEESTK